MTPSFDLTLLPLLALYAETHFRFFRFFPNFLFQRQPEVLFDMPKRLEPGADLPVVLIANDVNRFPAEFSDCALVVSSPGSPPKCFDFPDITKFEVEHSLRNCLRAFMLRISRHELPKGRIYVTACVNLRCGKKKNSVMNDNFRTTAKMAFSCFIAERSLPGSEFCSYGDLHVHSSYSQSHVEFGPPLAVVDAMVKASGMSFAAITDHSYDLACSMNDYLKHDPSLERWKTFQKEIRLPNIFSSLLIPSEEISCLNRRNEVVHLCGLNLQDYLPGTLDGARKDRSKSKQLTLREAIRGIHNQQGIAFAAHPFVKMGIMQRLFLQRGEWSKKDLEKDIDGMQILNSGFSPSWDRGKASWIERLLQGAKLPLLAGNDAHGDFNRYRAISIPFLLIGESDSRYMGYGKTGIYNRCASISDVVAGIKEGATFVTTGPFAGISGSVSPADSLISNQPKLQTARPVYIHGISTEEFGPIRCVTVLAGRSGNRAERSVFSQSYIDQKYRIYEKMELAALPFAPSYLRVEVSCGTSAAYTSPVYFS